MWPYLSKTVIFATFVGAPNWVSVPRNLGRHLFSFPDDYHKCQEDMVTVGDGVRDKYDLKRKKMMRNSVEKMKNLKYIFNKFDYGKEKIRYGV